MTEKTIYQALNAVMTDIRGVGKNEENKAPGAGYKFRGIDAVTNAVGPALREHGVIIAPKVLDSKYGTVTVGHKQTQMGHARLLIEFTWYGPAGDSLVTVAAGEAFDSGDKATAKAHSVAFRTAMIQTLCLPTDEKDPNEDTYERSTAEQDPAVAARVELSRLLRAIKVSPGKAAEKFKSDGHGDLGMSTDVEAITELTKYYVDAAAAE